MVSVHVGLFKEYGPIGCKATLYSSGTEYSYSLRLKVGVSLQHHQIAVIFTIFSYWSLLFYKLATCLGWGLGLDVLHMLYILG